MKALIVGVVVQQRTVHGAVIFRPLVLNMNERPAPAAKLEMLETDLIEKQLQVEEYIQTIQKSELRTMFRLYYIDNLTWYQVALKMNQMFPKRRIKYTEDSCKQRHKRFLEKVS